MDYACFRLPTYISVCNITEICDQEKAESLMSIYKFGPTTPLNDTHYVLSYTASLQGMASHSQISEYAKSRSHWTNSVNDNSTSPTQSLVACMWTFIATDSPTQLLAYLPIHRSTNLFVSLHIHLSICHLSTHPIIDQSTYYSSVYPSY
ncbi:hypothetical protein KP509_1Z304000 [Ceratopteris richardii]|nr:hypothetical protein KP509_1Z304000 [Ceratopteris richardii]